MASKKCPQCAEKVQAAAKVCRYCSYQFPEKPKPTPESEAVGAGCAVLLILVVGFFLVRSCSGSDTPTPKTESSAQEPDVFVVKVGAEENLKANLKDPSSAEFRSEFVSKLDNGGMVLCGEVNAKNAFGGYTGFKRFLASPNPNAPSLIEDESTGLGDEIDRKLFPTMYAQFCNNSIHRF